MRNSFSRFPLSAPLVAAVLWLGEARGAVKSGGPDAAPPSVKRPIPPFAANRLILPKGNTLPKPAPEAIAKPAESATGVAANPATPRFPDANALQRDFSAPKQVLQDEVTPIDLASALRLAGIRNPEILLAQARTLEATAIQQYAAAKILPSINLGTNYDMHLGFLQQSSGNILQVNRNSLYVGAGANAVAAGTVGIPGVQYNLNVSESIYGYLVTRQNVVSLRFAAQAMRNDILLQVALAYGELLRAEGHRSALIQTREESREVADLTAAYARTGLGLQADADRAATELARRNAEILQADAEILTASAALAQLLGLDPAIRLHPTDNWVVPRPVVPELIPLGELLAIALMQRPELRERRAAVQAALLALDGARVLPFSPQFITGVSGGTFGGGSNLIASVQASRFGVPQEPRFGTFDPRFDFDVIAYWSLRNIGAGNRAIIDTARARMGESNYELLDMLNRVRKEVTDADVATHAKFAEIDLRERAVRSSLDGYQEDLRRIRAHEGRPIEVLDNLRLLRQARLDYVDTIIDYNEAHLALYVALGQPPAAVLVRPAAENPPVDEAIKKKEPAPMERAPTPPGAAPQGD